MKEVLLIGICVGSGAALALCMAVALAVYPLFAQIPAEAFGRYHRAYMDRIAWIAAPVMIGNSVALGLWVMNGVGMWGALSAGAWILALGVTFGRVVPLHMQLKQKGGDIKTIEQLCAWHNVRTGLCALQLVLGVAELSLGR